MTTSKIFFVIVFIISIIFNMIYFLEWFSKPYDRCGILTRDVKVYLNKETYITLPKGLVVQDATLNGLAAIGQLSPYRFTITVTSDWQMVDYNVDWKSVHRFGSFYPENYASKKPQLPPVK